MENRLHRIIVISILILSLSASYVYALNVPGAPLQFAQVPTPTAGPGVTAAAGGPAADTTPPTVSLVSPPAGGTFTGTIGVIAAAFDAVGIDRVDFYIDGVKVGSDSTSPYTYDWNTTPVSDGSHTFSVAAYDTSGNVASAAEFVTVANARVAVAAVQPAVVQPAAVRKAYRVHNGAYQRLRQAQRLIARLRRSGFTGKIITQGGARPYLIQVGLLEDLTSARRLLRRLRARRFRFSGILEI